LQHLLFHIDGPPFGIKDEELQSMVREAYSSVAILREWINDWWVQRKATNGGAALPIPSAASKGYPIFPLRTLTEIDRLIVRVRAQLSAVTAPTMILQASDDDMTSPRNASIVYDEISSEDKQLVLLDDCYHVITVDKQKDVVAENMGKFFLRQLPGKQSHRQSQAGQLSRSS
jgi:pimeloyl-ACP methyl ester carboxylesterase